MNIFRDYDFDASAWRAASSKERAARAVEAWAAERYGTALAWAGHASANSISVVLDRVYVKTYIAAKTPTGLIEASYRLGTSPEGVALEDYILNRNA